MTRPVTFLVLAIAGTAAGPAFGYQWWTYNGHQYAVTNTIGNWTAAEAEAVVAGGHLVTVNNAAENTFLLNTFDPAPMNRHAYWTGFTDQFTEGHWVWIGEVQSPGQQWDGGWWQKGNLNSTSYANWAPPEPNDGSSSEDYGSIFDSQSSYGPPGGLWNDYGNAGDLPGIIEIPEPATFMLLAVGGIALNRRGRVG